MQTYCVSCKKNTENKDAKVVKTKNDRLQMRFQCSICGNKKSIFVKKQESKGIFSSLGIKTTFKNTRSKHFVLNIKKHEQN